jgi:molybdopterin synthase sulfur carrier subunit
MNPMHVQIRYFASIREALGLAAEAWSGPAQTVGQLRTALVARGGAYAEVLAAGRAVRMALDQVMVDEDAPLREGAELAFFPPVTGG